MHLAVLRRPEPALLKERLCVTPLEVPLAVPHAPKLWDVSVEPACRVQPQSALWGSFRLWRECGFCQCSWWMCLLCDERLSAIGSFLYGALWCAKGLTELCEVWSLGLHVRSGGESP